MLQMRRFSRTLFVILVIYWRLFRPAAPLIGQTTINALIFLLAAVQLLCLGILGEYLGRVYDEVKDRPIFTVNASLKRPTSRSHSGS